jgi:hypothetical protein
MFAHAQRRLGMGAIAIASFVISCQPTGSGRGGTAPPDDGDGSLEVVFPATGGALIVATVPDSGDSVTFYGSADEEADGVTFTALAMETAEGTTTVSLDAQERPSEISMGTLQITADYNADGTVNYALTEAGVVLHAGTDVSLAGFDVENLLAELNQGFIRRTSYRDQPLRTSGCYGEARYKSAFTEESVLASFVRAAIKERGYRSYTDWEQHDLPLYECVRADPEARDLARRICAVLPVYLDLANRLFDVCVAKHDDQDYCKQFTARAVDKLVAYINLMHFVGTQAFADARWDDPDCGCPKHECPVDFVCCYGQCIPKCGRDDQCPAETRCELGTGRCLQQCTTDGECPPGTACDAENLCTEGQRGDDEVCSVGDVTGRWRFSWDYECDGVIDYIEAAATVLNSDWTICYDDGSYWPNRSWSLEDGNLVRFAWSGDDVSASATLANNCGSMVDGLYYVYSVTGAIDTSYCWGATKE